MLTNLVRFLAVLVCLMHCCGVSQESAAAENARYRGPLLVMTGDDESPVKLWDRDGKPVFSPYYSFTKKGLGLVERDSSLRLEGGCFFTAGAEEVLAGGLQQADFELSLCGYIHPAAASFSGRGQIMGYGPADNEALFALLQERDELWFTIGAQRLKLLEKTPSEPFHFTLTVSGKEIVFYKNGAKAALHPACNADFTRSAKGIFVLGNDGKGGRAWRGRIELASMHNRALTADEARAAAASLLETVRKREPVRSIELKATLLTQSGFPKPWDEGFTYREVLAINEYRVTEVVRGEYKEAKIRVAEWQYVDRIFLANSQKKIGAEYKFVVEPVESNPQLSTIQRADTLELDLDITVYYDLSPIEALPKDQQPAELARMKQ